MKRSVYTVGSLVILLIAAFIFVLVPIFSGGTKRKGLPSLGKYEGTEIKYEEGSDFYNYLARYSDYYKNNGIEINNSNMYYVFNYAFNSTVTSIAYTNEVKKSGYIVPETAINRAMMPYFADETGKYSSKLYKLADPDQVQRLRNAFEKDFVANRFAEDNFGANSESIGEAPLYGLKSSAAELAFLQNVNKNQRGFNMAAFDMNNYPNTEKAAYGKNNAEKFVKYDLSVITVSDKTKAESISKKIASGETTFEDAVKNSSQKTYSTDSGKLTSKFNYQLAKIIEDENSMNDVISLAKDSVSAPVKTTIGYSIFKCDEVAVQPDFTNEDTLRTVYNYITSNEFSHIENYFTETAAAFKSVAEKKSFDAACKQYNVKKVEVPAFPLNYGNVSIADKLNTSLDGLSGASTNQNFLKTAFSLEKNKVSEPVTLNKNILVLQYTTSKADASEPVPVEALNDELVSFNSQSAQSALLSSPKLENHLTEVFYNNIMSNN